ncbi:MAG TPA: hypothetical protein VN947_26660 [Polyangia bacterium]|nr:hypothetical protein [Polyangia bacterium]
MSGASSEIPCTVSTSRARARQVETSADWRSTRAHLFAGCNACGAGALVARPRAAEKVQPRKPDARGQKTLGPALRLARASSRRTSGRASIEMEAGTSASPPWPLARLSERHCNLQSGKRARPCKLQ